MTLTLNPVVCKNVAGVIQSMLVASNTTTLAAGATTLKLVKQLNKALGVCSILPSTSGRLGSCFLGYGCTLSGVVLTNSGVFRSTMCLLLGCNVLSVV